GGTRRRGCRRGWVACCGRRGRIDEARPACRHERSTISLPRRVLHRLDTLARATGETRSGLIARMALESQRTTSRASPAHGCHGPCRLATAHAHAVRSPGAAPWRWRRAHKAAPRSASAAPASRARRRSDTAPRGSRRSPAPASSAPSRSAAPTRRPRCARGAAGVLRRSSSRAVRTAGAGAAAPG
ncbi:MAG: type II toxin-antitoxin system HicB family antitoxin, partial [Rhodoferax sp.]|nr:type II toxin-antitoxin system HicB family antitoxin [Rhodoferax sp.]